MKVRILEDHVVDRIAAGEVVERPASVLKELLENAIDAGSRRITIHLERGGTALVRVVDDGEGMSKEDALLAIERHATSKIRSDEDLEHVATLGFRGEALPSIASVSRFTLKTRPEGQEAGHALRLEGGKLMDVKPVAMTRGTDIEVKSLFFNTPARRRFLRTVPTELTHCLDLIRREVMMRPELDVTVRHDGREVLRAVPTEDGARRVADLLGADVQGQLVPVAHEANGVRVSGFVGVPSVHRSSTTQAVFAWVGGRAVRDPLIRRAVLDAARARMVAGRYPIVAIRVEVPPGEVDVNVHPAKTEVRFRQARQVSDAVRAALEAAWSRRAAPQAPPVASADEEAPDLFARPERPPPSVAAMPDLSSGAAPPVVASTSEGDREPGVDSWRAPEAPPPLAGERPEPVEPPVAHEPAPAPPEVPDEPAAPAVTFVGQVGSVGLLAGDGALWLVDLALQAVDDPGPARPLLMPEAVSLPRPALEAVLAGAEVLEEAGIGVRAFAPGQVAVTVLPEALDPGDAAELVGALAEALQRHEDIAPVVARWVQAPTGERARRAAERAWQEGQAVRVSEATLRAWWSDGR